MHEGDRPPYQWRKYSYDSGESSEVPAGIHRTLTFEVEGPGNGGMYRCHSSCQGEELNAWIRLHGMLPIVRSGMVLNLVNIGFFAFFGFIIKGIDAWYRG